MEENQAVRLRHLRTKANRENALIAEVIRAASADDEQLAARIQALAGELGDVAAVLANVAGGD